MCRYFQGRREGRGRCLGPRALKLELRPRGQYYFVYLPKVPNRLLCILSRAVTGWVLFQLKLNSLEENH